MESINWQQAVDFCKRLTQLDSDARKTPPGPIGHFSLPTYEQWKVFAEGADLKSAVYGTDRPAKVGSKVPSNDFGVYDVLGNVREWLNGKDMTNKSYIGGGFRSQPSFGGMRSFITPDQREKDMTFDDLGFRVIWISNP